MVSNSRPAGRTTGATTRLELPRIYKKPGGGGKGGGQAPPNWPDITVQAIVLDASLLPSPTQIEAYVQQSVSQYLPPWLPRPNVVAEFLGASPSEVRIGVWFGSVSNIAASLSAVPPFAGPIGTFRAVVTQGFLEHAVLWFIPISGLPV